MPRFSGSLAPLQHESFRWYWIALTVNLAGTTMSAVALAFAVLAISDSPSALGVVLAAGTAPTILFLLVGGVIADRLPLTVVLRVGMVVLAASQGAAAALVITGVAEIWMLVVLEAVNGTALALVFPAMQSITPQLVPRDLLQKAIALQSFSRGALRIVGPTISALLVVGVGAGWALAVDATTWFAAAVILVKVRLPPPAPREEAASALGELRQGWDYVRRTTWLWAVVLGFTFLNVIYAGAWLTLGPARANETIGPKGWGLVLSGESVGLVVAAVVLLHRPLKRPLFTGMVWTAALAVPLVVLGVYPHVWLMLPVAFVAGIGFDVFGMGWNLAMQEHVPPDMLSRAYSYDALGSYVAIPLGQLAFGPIGAAFGYRDVLVVSAVVYVLICLLVLSSRSVRDLRRVPVRTTVS
jgi:MFS family permease